MTHFYSAKAKMLKFCFLAIFIFPLPTLLAQVPSYVPTNGLIGWWPFNGNANDESGNGNHGTITGATLTSDRTGQSARAYLFNQNDLTHDIEVPISSGIAGIASNFTAVTWVKPTRTVNAVTNSNACPGDVSVPMAFSNQNWAINPPNFGTDIGIGLSVGTNGAFIANHANNLLVCRGNEGISNSGFSFIAIVHQGNSIKLYLDGDLVDAVNDYCPTRLKKLSSTIRLGGSMYSSAFSGIIDDFGVWNRALTDAEIQNLYIQSTCSYGDTIYQSRYDQICPNDTVHLFASGPAKGLIFHDKGSNSNGWRYMETPIQDISSGLALGCPNGPNATTSIAVGTGLSNSTNIDGVCFDTNYAATKSLLYSLNGYNDWFLPSQGDFDLMHQNLHKKGVGNFRNYSGPNWIVQNSNRYWTSSLLAQYGYAFDFGNGSTIPVNNQIVGRNELNRVRPARFVSGEVKYLWSTGDTTPNITVNPAQTTTYYLTATHNGMVCTDSTTIMVSGTPSNFAPYGRDSVVLCSDSARLDAGPGYVSYLWSHGANSKVTFVSTPGWYTITVVDSIGCSGVDSVFVYNSDLSASIIVDQNASCFGGSNGRAILTVTGGTAPYLINWSNGSASNDTLSNLSAGLYWVLVTDALGCAISDSVSIQEPQLALTAITSKTNVSCHGGNDGSVAVAASGGTGPYSYTWLTNPPRSGNALINVSAGIYPVMVVDANGCQYTTSLVVSEPTALVNSVTVQHVQCFGQPNGSAVVQTSGGTAGYQYAWNGGAFTLNNSMGGLDTGLNYVEILDANGCSDSIAFVVNGPPSPIQHLATATNVSCYGLSNGSAQVLASGGSGSLQITWNTIPIAVGSSIIGRPAGTYKYTILDVVHGCMVVDSVVISQPIAPLSHTTITTDVLCYSDSSGSAQVTPLGGSSPYSINWTSSSIVGFNPASLWAGWHFFTLTDANGCLLSDSLEIKEPLVPLTLATGVTNVSCYGDSTGSAWVSASGGTGPYVVLWSANNATNDTLTGIPSGTYSVTVTDSVGCFATQIITVQQPQLPLTITTISQSALCFGTNSGTAAVIVQGGTGPYSIMWSDTLSSTTTSITQLYSGWYFVNVTDQNGCSILDSVFVGQPSSSLSIQSGTTSVGCFGSATGSAWVSANGGTAPYTYFWPHNGTTNDSITNLSAGTYLIQVQDANQCSETLSISITQTAPLTSITSQQHILCKGDSTGSITVSPQGGWSPYRIVWNTGDTNMVLNNLYAGMYSASITDSLGCSDSIFIQITEPQSALNSIGLSTDATCSGSIDGSIQVIASGGVGPYSYSLNSQTPVPQGIFTSLSAGTYICAITDANGCSITDTFQINEPNPISFVAAVDPVTCFGNSDGAIDLTISGGTNSYNVIWSTGATGPKLSGISGGWYQFSINDGNGCGLTDSIFVAEPDVLLLTLSVLHPECSNSFNGSITGIASGGSGNYSFTMNNNSSNGIEPNLGVGTYTVSVVDANGCSESTTIQLSAQRTPCVEIPNWFSPNGNGTNDSWEIPGFEYGNYTLYVVNVWGQKIYQTSSDNYLPWDGTFNGEPMPNGDYYYVISSTDETEPTFAGYVTILR
jgi:gliding motility-associated-like protein